MFVVFQWSATNWLPLFTKLTAVLVTVCHFLSTIYPKAGLISSTVLASRLGALYNSFLYRLATSVAVRVQEYISMSSKTALIG